MRIITLNINGIRAGARKGFFSWMTRQKADVVCLQETRAQFNQIESDPVYFPRKYHYYHADAERKGYSGVAVYSRRRPEAVTSGLGWPDIDAEGRYLQIDFEGLSVISLYVPSGTSGDVRQSFKYDFMDRFESVLAEKKNSGREVVICGDWNIAHKNIDIRNWRSNQKNSGFLPDERKWMDWLFDEAAYVDAFRTVNQQEDQYTWWSNRGQAWAKNVGWRIDYQIITPGLRDKVRAASIYKRKRFSDHAPLIIDYDVNPDIS
jgi:exodeoxyribonuclease-3